MANEIYVDEADEKEARRSHELDQAFLGAIQAATAKWAREDGSYEFTNAHCDVSLSALLNTAVDCAKVAGVPREKLLEFIGRIYDGK